jgi:hypothetical protein
MERVAGLLGCIRSGEAKRYATVADSFRVLIRYRDDPPPDEAEKAFQTFRETAKTSEVRVGAAAKALSKGSGCPERPLVERWPQCWNSAVQRELPKVFWGEHVCVCARLKPQRVVWKSLSLLGCLVWRERFPPRLEGGAVKGGRF